MPKLNNPNLSHYSKRTQFKRGNKAGRKNAQLHSIRNELRYYASQRIDPKKIDAELKRLLRIRPKINRTTLGRMVIISFIGATITQKTPGHFSALINHTEGKIPSEDKVQYRDPNTYPGSYRNELRFILQQDIEEVSEAEFEKLLYLPDGKNPTIARLVAVCFYKAALQSKTPTLHNLLIKNAMGRSSSKGAAIPDVERPRPFTHKNPEELDMTYEEIMKIIDDFRAFKSGKGLL